MSAPTPPWWSCAPPHHGLCWERARTRQAGPVEECVIMTLPRPMVADTQSIVATRDTGYRGVPAAIGELIDNSVQARATVVSVFVRDDRPRRGIAGAPACELTIGVLDNGRGMEYECLWTGVQFGGTE